MNYDTTLLKAISKALRQVNGRKLRRMEKKLEKGVLKALEKQQKYILSKARKLIEKSAKKVLLLKGLDEDIDRLIEEIDNDELESLILASSESSMLFGARYRIKKSKLGKYGITFDLSNELAISYLETDRPLVLAKIADTTKKAIKPILIDSVKNGTSYNETAKIIRSLGAFSKSRAQMIATNEIGHAYEWGNRIPMLDLKSKGFDVLKKWSTVNDSLVTPECLSNEDDGWIDINSDFNSGDQNAPRGDHPRCRCTILYNFNE